MKKNSIPNRYVRFKGVKINNIDYAGIQNTINLNLDTGGYICLTCVWCVMQAMKDKTFFQAIDDSLLSVADGTPLVWYAKLLGCRKIERVSGPELLRRMLQERNGLKHFLLGDTEQTIQSVIERAKKVNEDIRITGYSPPFKNLFKGNDNELIFDRINREKPDIIWVSFGGGKQDKWMYRNFHRLQHGVMVGVGAAFRFYIDVIYTPPRFIQKLGLQWLFRVLQDPVKGIKIRLLTDPKFIFYFPWEVLKNWTGQ